MKLTFRFPFSSYSVFRATVECKCEKPHPKDSKDPPHNRAIKIFHLKDPSKQEWAGKCLKNEMFIAKNMKHPNIVMTYDVIKTNNNAYIIMRYAPNGSIKSDLCERLKRPYTNDEAKDYFTGLMNGLQYMHAHNIAHRDLKLENFLLSGSRVPMLADFGFAARIKVAKGTVLTHMMQKTFCGTKVSNH